jgi:hypothetical protein
MRKRRKEVMGSFQHDGAGHTCSQAPFWPPVEIEAYGETSAQALRYVVSDLIFQRIRTWEQVCGLMEMNPNKCLTCPYVLRDGKRLKPVGTGLGKHIHTRRSIKKSRQGG